MNHALAYAVLATLLWGVWGVALDRATRVVPRGDLLLVSSLCGLLVAVGYIAAVQERSLLGGDLLTGLSTGPPGAAVGLAWAVAAGLLTAVASVLFYLALERGGGVPVVTVGSLYFVVTAVLLAGLFDADLAATDLGALALSVGAVVLYAV